jgi:beta-glucanase (GH16 family)
MQQEGGHGWGNNERQFYTGENRNTIIKDGFLTIQARNEQYQNRNFTSARLKTYEGFKYGVFEMRAKLPLGRGTWPAFWMLANTVPLKWPDDGEIDILEHVGKYFKRDF